MRASIGGRLETLDLVDEIGVIVIADVLLVRTLYGVTVMIHVELTGPRRPGVLGADEGIDRRLVSVLDLM
ncbi:MAG: hypothetical protein H5T76_25185 [Streptomyces sp.]|nr:hypothetical protein [Streptomyces sp.]